VSVSLALVANDLLFAVVGWSFLTLTGIAAWLGPGVRLLGLAYLTGWALLGVALSVALMIGFPLTVASVVLLAGALTVCCLLGARRRWLAPLPRRASQPPSRIDRYFSWIGAVALAAGALIAVAASIRGQWNGTNDFDVFLFWLPKAESIYVSHGLDAALWRQFVHTEYPPLAPTMNALTFTFSGGFHPALLPFQQTMLGLSFLLGTLALLDRMVPRRLSVPTLALLATAPWFWRQLPSAMPDQTVAYLIAAAALAGTLWLLEPHPAWLALALVFLAGGTLTKLEGMLSALTIAVVLLAASVVRYGRRGLIAAVLLAGPGTILAWRAWLQTHDLPGSSPDYALSNLLDPNFLEHRTTRLHLALSSVSQIGGQMFAEALPLGGLSTLGQSQTHLFLLCLAVLLVFVARTAPVVAAAVASWLVLAYTGLATIYWIGRIPIQQYIAETIDRVLETPAVVTLTLLPLLLCLALRLKPEAGPTDP
jgi:hypothetical protein